MTCLTCVTCVTCRVLQIFTAYLVQTSAKESHQFCHTSPTPPPVPCGRRTPGLSTAISIDLSIFKRHRLHNDSQLHPKNRRYLCWELGGMFRNHQVLDVAMFGENKYRKSSF